MSPFYGQSCYNFLEQDLGVCETKLINILEKKNLQVTVTYIVILFLT